MCNDAGTALLKKLAVQLCRASTVKPTNSYMFNILAGEG